VLDENRSKFPRALVVDRRRVQHGCDVAPLDQIYEVVQQYEAFLMVDDAHGEGVLGRGGAVSSTNMTCTGKSMSRLARYRRLSVWWRRSSRQSIGGGMAAPARPPLPVSSAMTIPDTAACLAGSIC